MARRRGSYNFPGLSGEPTSRLGLPPPFDGEVPLAHANLRVFALNPELDRSEQPVGSLLRRVREEVVVVKLLRDAREDLDQVRDPVREEELAPRLLSDALQEPLVGRTAGARNTTRLDAYRVDR